MDLIQQMKFFKKIVEVGSFSEAARELGVSLSIISRQIEDLEKKVNTRLLHRTTRKTVPTELGEIYYHRIQNVLQDINELNELLLDHKLEPQGTLKITASHIFGQFYLSNIIPKFLEKYPKIQIKLELSDSLVDIVGGGFDVAFRSGKLEDTSLARVKLKPQKYIVCAANKYLKINGTPKILNDLKKHNAILFSEGNSFSPWYLIRNKIAPEKLNISGQIIVNQGILYKEFIKKGLGLGLVYSWAVEDELKSGEIVKVLSDFNISYSGIVEEEMHMLFSKGNFLSSKVRVFIDYIKEISK